MIKANSETQKAQKENQGAKESWLVLFGALLKSVSANFEFEMI